MLIRVFSSMRIRNMPEGSSHMIRTNLVPVAGVTAPLPGRQFIMLVLPILKTIGRSREGEG